MLTHDHTHDHNVLTVAAARPPVLTHLRPSRYYRVWIYACNVALLAATLVFAAAFAWLTTDFRIQVSVAVLVKEIAAPFVVTLSPPCAPQAQRTVHTT